MKFEGIKTNAEGLIKLINYLHSDKNLYKIQDNIFEQFCLETVSSIYTPSSHIRIQNYNIVITSRIGNPEKENVSGLIKLISEVYIQ